MRFASGARVGVYEIVSLLGAGGMGEVYRARDARLQRDVALKILPEVFAADPERLARFEREAHVLASLNHPRIAQIYGIVEDSAEAGHHALVMELVEGETLADRIARGAMPVDEALAIARQIADAIDAAHDKGIIHRDLKPANIKVTSEGVVKVLDFGLAKLNDPSAPNASSGLSISPTLTSPVMATGVGMLLGTAAYMSPEQARGKPVDKRADIWAFGVIVYEMLTGRRPFVGETITDVLAATVRDDVDLRDIPPQARDLITACLHKDPSRRLRDIGDLPLLLRESTADPAASPARLTRRTIAWTTVAALLGAALASAVLVWLRPQPAPAPLMQLSLAHPGPEAIGGNEFDANVAVSPDGRAVAYVAGPRGVVSNTLRLYVRSLDERTPRLVSASARAPFFSPDGQWIGFVEDNQHLSKVPIAGGPAVAIGGAANAPRGASWGPDGTIVFATANTSTGLMRIPAVGGEPVVLTRPDGKAGELDHVYPFVLPNGRGVLFTITTPQSVDLARIAILDVQTGKYTVLIQGGMSPRYVAPGFLVYAAGGGLRAVRFDADRMQIVGTPRPVFDGVETRPSGAAAFGVAANGTLAYVESSAEDRQRTFVWVDRRGREEPLPLQARNYSSFALSPDGGRLAVAVTTDANESDIWIWSNERRTLSRLTFADNEEAPIWTRDSASIVYTDYSGSGVALRLQRADGTGSPLAVLSSGADRSRVAVTTDGWTPEGRLVFEELRQSGDWEMKTIGVDPAGERSERALLPGTGAREGAAAASPDGRWLAYVSNESGRPEVYVRPYPTVDAGKWQVSADGGTTPRWSADGRTLFFLGTDEDAVMGAAVRTTSTFSIAAPQLIVRVPERARTGLRNLGGDFDVSPDGQRFLFMKGGERASSPSVNVVLNWVGRLGI